MINFLVIRFSSIGDIVLTTPVISSLKEQCKDSKVYFLTKSKFKDVLKNNPYIDELILFDENLKITLDELKSKRIDYIIDLHNNIRSKRIKNALRVIAFTVNKINWPKWLMVNLKINKLPKKHIVDRNFDTVKHFDISNAQTGLEYYLDPETDKVDLSDISENLKQGYVGLVIGAMHFTKQIPDEKLIEICNGLNKPVLLLGGTAESEKADIIIKASRNKNVINTCGKFSINQSAYLVKMADSIITSDTGLMHIAAAFKKKIISIWGNTVPEFGMYPYLPGEGSKIHEIKGLKCRPCSKIGYQKCPKKHFKCMQLQNVDQIVADALN